LLSLHSVRFRITFWFVLTVALILGASGIFWYLSLSRSLHAEVDERLLAAARGAAGVRLELGREDLPLDLCRELAQRFELAGKKNVLALLGRDGEPICHSRPSPQDIPSPSSQILQQAALGTPQYVSVSGQQRAPLRLLVYPLYDGARINGYVVVGASLEWVERILDRLWTILLIGIPLPLLALALGGWFLADRALAPVAAIARTMESINTENLSQRLPGADEKNEFGRLIKNFNAMLEHLETSFRRVRQFAADASHELRTPLTVLRGETEVALRWTKNPEELRRILESNLEEVDRMSHIVEDLLLLAKSEVGEIPFDLKQVNLSEMLEELYLQGRVLGENKGVAVGLNLPPDPVIIAADELRIRQMILNIISNGIKYTPSGGRVDIRLEATDAGGVVTVSDTGIGMDRENLEKIFERFYRIDKGRGHGESGAGLGLSIVKWIVDAHGGSIDVDSEQGKGSTFRITLPAAGPQQQS